MDEFFDNLDLCVFVLSKQGIDCPGWGGAVRSAYLQCSQYWILSAVAGSAKWYFRSNRLGRLDIPASNRSTAQDVSEAAGKFALAGRDNIR